MADRCRPVRRLLASAAVGAVLLILVPVGEAGTEPSVCPHSPHVRTHGPWTMLERPEGLGKLRGAAVDADRPETIYVTDGRRIALSMSGGCAWQIVLDLTNRGAAEPLVGAEITSVLVPQGRLGRVYATVDTTGPLSAVSNEAVLASFDQGASWQTARGLPALHPSLLRASPADPNVMYLSMHTGGTGPATVTVNSIQVGAIWSFHASTDGGRSWTQRSTGRHRARFVPDSTDPNGVWALGSESSAFEGPYRSADGGRTWVTTASPPADDVDRAEIDVYRTMGGVAQIVIAHNGGSPANAPSLYLSPDEGRTFRKLPADGLAGALWSVAFGRSKRDIVVSTDLGVYRFNSQLNVWFDIDSQHLAPLRDATRIRGAPQESWWFWRPELVALYREIRPPKAMLGDEAIPLSPVGCSPSHHFAPAERPRVPSASLEVLDEPLDLEPSVPSRADFHLSLPAVPTALDTYFLLDTSLSMKGAIDGIGCGLEQLVNGLTRAGVDAHFGLGEFQDADGLRYRRVVDIGPPGYELQNALRGRRLAGGEEPHRGALYQAATGAGMRTPSGDVLIPPGQEATYRPEAMRVVLLVTDEPYEVTTTYEPTVSQVIDALRSRGIHHLGIHVRSAEPLAWGSIGDDAQTRLQLEEFSRGTRTFAPAGGVDCDGDGSVDLAPGAPLVCSVDREGIEANLAETLTALLLAVREDAIAGLRPVRTAGMHVNATRTQTIDVHDDHAGRRALPLSASVTCTEEQVGTQHTLVMAADVSGREVARAPFGVRCGQARTATEDGRPPTAVAAAPPGAAPVPVTAAEPSLSSTISSATAANPAPGQAVGLQGEMHGAAAAAFAPDEREPGVELTSPNFTDAATATRVLGAGALFAGSVVFERRRRTARRAFSTVRR